MIQHIPTSVYKFLIIGGVSVFIFVPILYFNKYDFLDKGTVFFTTESEDDFVFNGESCKYR